MKKDKAIILIIGLVVLVIGTLTLIAGLARHYGVREGRDAPEPAIKAPSKPVEQRTIIFRVTAYCKESCCCGAYADGITASGYRIKDGDKLIAAPKSIPFGTWINIEGYGYAEVLDRGGAIKGRRLDVLFPTHQEALNWGVKYIEVKE